MMEPLEEDKNVSWFRKLEDWYLENDLHIWSAIVALIAFVILLFIFDKEIQKSEKLKDQVTLLQLDLTSARMVIADLRTENEKQRALYLLPSVSKENTLDKSATKVTEKINKVQDILIDKTVNQPTKVRTETVINNIEIKTPVNKELNAMMKDSYCSTVPSAKECK